MVSMLVLGHRRGHLCAVSAPGSTGLRGNIDDIAILQRGAAAADAVIHLVTKHD
jgi:hypothetical protein